MKTQEILQLILADIKQIKEALVEYGVMNEIEEAIDEPK